MRQGRKKLAICRVKDEVRKGDRRPGSDYSGVTTLMSPNLLESAVASNDDHLLLRYDSLCAVAENIQIATQIRWMYLVDVKIGCCSC